MTSEFVTARNPDPKSQLVREPGGLGATQCVAAVVFASLGGYNPAHNTQGPLQGRVRNRLALETTEKLVQDSRCIEDGVEDPDREEVKMIG